MALTLAESRDTYCVDEIKPGRLARGVQLLAQRCYHRLTTPPGTLRGGEEEADFGLDLAGFVGSTEDSALESMLPVRVQNELRKDPAIDSVKVDALRTENAKRVSWDLSIHIESVDGEVDLLLRVDEVTVQLLRVS